MSMLRFLCFFFSSRRRHTRSLCDWSSDVCSSDLEAAIRWYERAFKLPGIDEETRIALNYELASAYENAGNKPAALSHFMEVYGSNIDYRDVAERIKALKS